MSWKCFLSTFSGTGNGHPPCEDVSWKLFHSHLRSDLLRHPPCEDVSWKTPTLLYRSASSVILLVRMWVERIRIWSVYVWSKSSSLWGCELKDFLRKKERGYRSHPPCEDVSWKNNIPNGKYEADVILLVRMWVERSEMCQMLKLLKSSSLWGCELKEDIPYSNPSLDNVILLVRMWVERTHVIKRKNMPVSSSLWGCELKEKKGWIKWKIGSHPPCEDVSWKFIPILRKRERETSSSLWGCELKEFRKGKTKSPSTSSSLWGCELKGKKRYL